MKMNNLIAILKQAKNVTQVISQLSSDEKRELLLSFADELLQKKGEILQANRVDVLETKKEGATNAFIDRLTLTEKGFQGMIAQLITVANLVDPIGEKIEEKNLPNGVHLVKQRFPIGVVFMIYESRPNVTIDVAGLCIKSGNVVILKGGSEAKHTNTELIRCIHAVLKRHGLPAVIVIMMETLSHKEVNFLLRQNKYIDVVIPRGSYRLTTTVASHARMPILYHASGGARMYIDASADLEQAFDVCMNAKTQRTGVCNALDVVLVHKDVIAVLLPRIDAAMKNANFEVRADRRAKKYMISAKRAQIKDFKTEFLDSVIAVKVVDTADEAISFMQLYTHGHTEILMANNKSVINQFIATVDAAGLMINCSSRLHDGGEFGMGAEMGTATGKLHARGPVGVKELTTYKWIAYGSGQVRK